MTARHYTALFYRRLLAMQASAIGVWPSSLAASHFPLMISIAFEERYFIRGHFIQRNSTVLFIS